MRLSRDLMWQIKCDHICFATYMSLICQKPPLHSIVDLLSQKILKIEARPVPVYCLSDVRRADIHWERVLFANRQGAFQKRKDWTFSASGWALIFYHLENAVYLHKITTSKNNLFTLSLKIKHRICPGFTILESKVILFQRLPFKTSENIWCYTSL